jgi:hypothetical protein
MGGWVGLDEVLGAGCLASCLGRARDCQLASVGGLAEWAGHQARLGQRQPVAPQRAASLLFALAAAAARDAVLVLPVLVLASQQVRWQVQQYEWVLRLVPTAAEEQPVLALAVRSQAPVVPLRPARKAQAR